jgi:hypothetical protein
MRRSAAVPLVFLSVAVAFSLSVGVGESSASNRTGTISGKVVECPPGPVVASTNKPTPKPATVELIHDSQTYMSQSINFPANLPWSGTFSFKVPAGRYDVVSTYQGRNRWVTVRPGRRSLVSFGVFACPL